MSRIYARFFRGAGFVPDRSLDDARAVLHRKTRALAALVHDRVVSSAVRAAPRCAAGVGAVVEAPVLWLRDEGAAGARAALWGAAPRYAPRATRAAETEVKARLLRIRSVLRSLGGTTE